MSRRTVATLRRPDPHDFEPDPETRGYCKRCHLIKANKLHDPEAVAAWKRDQAYNAAQAAAAQEQHRRRTGES